MRPSIPMLLLTLVACGPQGIEGEGQLDSAESPEVGEWSSCFTKDDFTTCAQACQSEGLSCLPGGCPATPDTCTPDDCESATVVIAFNETICEDVTLGSFLNIACDDPIGWQANSIGRCCCAQ